MDPIIAFFAALVSLAVSIVLIACAITAARALRRLADEAAQLRRILGIIAETELARGKNELANIELTTGNAESAHLYQMPELKAQTPDKAFPDGPPEPLDLLFGRS